MEVVRADHPPVAIPPENRRRWPRLTLTLPPEAADALGVIAQGNYRNRKQEALRLLMDGIEQESRTREPAAPR